MHCNKVVNCRRLVQSDWKIFQENFFRRKAIRICTWEHVERTQSEGTRSTYKRSRCFIASKKRPHWLPMSGIIAVIPVESLFAEHSCVKPYKLKASEKSIEVLAKNVMQMPKNSSDLSESRSFAQILLLDKSQAAG